jgi:hypothetical protein
VLDSGWGMGRKHWFEVDDPSLPRGVLFHDSFGAYIDGLMAEHFSRLACFWQYDFDTRVVLSEHPDVVVELYVERVLQNLSPTELMPRQVNGNDDAFASSNEIVFALDVEKHATTLKSMGQAEIYATRDDSGPAIVIDMKTLGDTFLLPEFDFPSGKRLLVHVDLTSPSAGITSIFYKHAHDSDYNRKNSCIVPLSKGRNQAYFEIEQGGLSGPLMVRAGDHIGRYALQAFEIRALPYR